MCVCVRSRSSLSHPHVPVLRRVPACLPAWQLICARIPPPPGCSGTVSPPRPCRPLPYHISPVPTRSTILTPLSHAAHHHPTSIANITTRSKSVDIHALSIPTPCLTPVSLQPRPKSAYKRPCIHSPASTLPSAEYHQELTVLQQHTLRFRSPPRPATTDENLLRDCNGTR